MRCMRCIKIMRKYETDERYPSQYDFYNRARVSRRSVSLAQGVLRSLQWQFNYWQFDLAEN